MGTVQPVAEVVEHCRRLGIRTHVDAVAAAGHVPVDLDGLGADLVSVSAHKLGGPAGIGALIVRRGLRLEPFLVGGEQERARRAGLENVAAAIGFGAAAAALADPDTLAAEEAAGRQWTDRARPAAERSSGVTAFGDPVGRLPHIVCLGVEGVEAEPVLLGLDQAGIAVHSGSSCSSETLEPSPVLEAMGVDGERSLRLSVGWSTTDARHRRVRGRPSRGSSTACGRCGRLTGTRRPAEGARFWPCAPSSAPSSVLSTRWSSRSGTRRCPARARWWSMCGPPGSTSSTG